MTRIVLAAMVLAPMLVMPVLARAQTAPSPAARPRGEPASQSSVPAAAPPASITQTTGTPPPDATVKQMNDAEKAKVDAQGK